MNEADVVVNDRDLPDNTGEKKILGNYAEVKFTSLPNNQPVKAKIDTGATMSSLHARDVNIRGKSVTFVSDVLSPNKITMDMKSQQDIGSADGGVERRPVVVFDIELDGHPVPGVEFNLNDRTDMDTPILIGQNILQGGHFLVDPKDGHEESKPEEQEPQSSNSGTSDAVAQKINAMRAGPNEAEILKALEVLKESNITLKDLVKYLRTVAVNEVE